MKRKTFQSESGEKEKRNKRKQVTATQQKEK